MKVCDPMAGALSGRERAPKPCGTQQRAGSQSRLWTDLRDRWASCVSPEGMGFVPLSPPAITYGQGSDIQPPFRSSKLPGLSGVGLGHWPPLRVETRDRTCPPPEGLGP